MATFVSADSQTNNTGGNYAFNDSGTYSHMAQSFAPTTSYSVYSIQLSLLKAGTPLGTIKVSIRAESGGNPGSSITNGDSITMNASSLSTSTAFVEFTFSTPPSLVSGTTYYIELTHTGGTFNGTDTVGWSRSGANSYAGGIMELQTNSGGWTDIGGEDFAWKMYKADLGGSFLHNFL